MEVAAAQLAYQDEQLGRVIDELRRMGQLDNTLVAVIKGDNGASGEAGPKGTINELRSMGSPRRGRGVAAGQHRPARRADDLRELSGRLGLGDEHAAALDQAICLDAGRRAQRHDPVMARPRGKPGSVCGQFGHLIDIAPTVLDAAKLPAPRDGARRRAEADGRSEPAAQPAACEADKPRTQYFEMTGKVGLYHDGWFLSGENGRPAWENLPPSSHPKVEWTLYDLRRDFSQSTDVAAKEPARLQAMLDLWQQEASATTCSRSTTAWAPGAPTARATMAGRASTSTSGARTSACRRWAAQPILFGRAFTLDADLVLDKPRFLGRGGGAGQPVRRLEPLPRQGPAGFHLGALDRSERDRASARRPGAAAGRRQADHAVCRPAARAAGGSGVERRAGRNWRACRCRAAILMPAGGGETLDVGRDLGVT